MGFLGGIITKAVLKTARNLAAHEAIKHIENTRSVDALVEKSKGEYILIISQDPKYGQRGFLVTDEHENKKYIIKTAKHCAWLCDMEKHEIGKAVLQTKDDEDIYAVFLEGKQLGIIKSLLSVKVKMRVTFNGWYLEGKTMRTGFTVTDKNGNAIMKYNDAFSLSNKGVLEMSNCENEIMGLLLYMAFVISGE